MWYRESCVGSILRWIVQCLNVSWNLVKEILWLGCHVRRAETPAGCPSERRTHTTEKRREHADRGQGVNLAVDRDQPEAILPRESEKAIRREWAEVAPPGMPVTRSPLTSQVPASASRPSVVGHEHEERARLENANFLAHRRFGVRHHDGGREVGDEIEDAAPERQGGRVAPHRGETHPLLERHLPHAPADLMGEIGADDHPSVSRESLRRLWVERPDVERDSGGPAADGQSTLEQTLVHPPLGAILTAIALRHRLDAPPPNPLDGRGVAAGDAPVVVRGVAGACHGAPALTGRRV